MPSEKQHFITRRKFVKCSTAATAGALFAAGICPVFPTTADGKERRRKWFRDIYRILHTDPHFGGFKEIYRNFDAEATAQMYKDAGFQLVSYFAQDGPSYYPTKIGVVHPGLERDYTGELTRALKKRGIKTIVYIAAMREPRHHKEHPDWIYNPDPARTMVDKSSIGESATMCLNTPWVDEVFIPVCKEILELYDVDGFFPDGVMRPFDYLHCYCKYCRESFEKEVGGKMPTDASDPKAYAYRKWSNRCIEEYMDKVFRALSEVKPDIAILNNYAWMARYPITPPPYVMHVCWDTPVPDQGLYSLNFSFEARYLSTLPDVIPDITWSCMNVSSHTWSDYELRETNAFMHECAILLAGCGRTYLSYNPYPSGNPVPALMEAFDEVNRRTIELEPYLKDCAPVKDAAVLHSADSIWSKVGFSPSPNWPVAEGYYPVCGAHKALIEGHVQIGIPNSEVFVKTIHEYGAVILPDQRVLSERECDEIRTFVKNGGALIATGETGTRDIDNNLLNNFSIADVLGVEYLETADTANSYLRVTIKNEEYGIPSYDIPVVGPYVRIKTTTAKTLLELVPPFEGIKRGTPPPAVESEGPGVTINSFGKGKAVYCSSKLFSAYYEQNTPVLRKLALWMLGLVYPVESRTIVLENTPINVELFYNRRNNERFIHLVNYSGDKREVGTPQAQDFTAVHGIRIRVKLGVKPKRVTAVPGGKDVEVTYRNGRVLFDADPLSIHSVYRIEI